MRILLLTHAFNSLTQRLWVELTARGHELSVEFDIHDTVAEEAVALFRPDLVLAPFLKRAIPESVWSVVPCLIVHPGPPGDRGPSSLDWAVMNGEIDWGVTVLQATELLDGGPVWSWREFPMRADATKASLYRNEVTHAAVACVLEALERIEAGAEPEVQRGGTWRALMKQQLRVIDWAEDNTGTVLRKIRAADGFPGVLDDIAGQPVYLFDAHREEELRGEPGALIARHGEAVCRATIDGAVWIGRMKERGERGLKLPAVRVLGKVAESLPEAEPSSWREVWSEEKNGALYLHFPFYNGAMSAERCRRLEAAFREACEAEARVIVLLGGPDFWSNGLDLNTIEAAESAADESLANIEAMDDLCQAVIEATDKHVIAAMRGNAGAGGVFLALAADHVLARDGVVLNPHYKNMGNLYGSEYWTYLLPRRVGEDGVRDVLGRRLPIGAGQALGMGLIDGTFIDIAEVEAQARDLAASPDLDALLAEKKARREADEAAKPLIAYRGEELERMNLNFYGFDPSYHVARYNFVYRIPHSRTPLHLARHRRRNA